MTWQLALLALLDLAVLGNLDGSRLPGEVRPFVHVTLTALALAICLRDVFAGRRLGPAKLLIGAAFGPLGLLAIAWAKPFERTFRRTPRLAGRPDTNVDGPEALPSPTAVMVSRTLDGRVSYPEAHQLNSLHSTLRYGDSGARHKALQTVVRSFEPQLSSLIALALTDGDQTLRALAASASAHISFEVAQKCSELEQMVANHRPTKDIVPIAAALAEHGLHNSLLPQSQRLRLMKTSAQLLSECSDDVLDDRMVSRQVAALQTRLVRSIGESVPVAQLQTNSPGTAELVG